MGAGRGEKCWEGEGKRRDREKELQINSMKCEGRNQSSLSPPLSIIYDQQRMPSYSFLRNLRTLNCSLGARRGSSTLTRYSYTLTSLHTLTASASLSRQLQGTHTLTLTTLFIDHTLGATLLNQSKTTTASPPPLSSSCIPLSLLL